MASDHELWLGYVTRENLPLHYQKQFQKFSWLSTLFLETS